MIRRFMSSLSKSPVVVTPQAWLRMGNILKSQDSFCFHLEGWAFCKLLVSIRLCSKVKINEHKNKSSFIHHNN